MYVGVYVFALLAYTYTSVWENSEKYVVRMGLCV